MHPPGSADTSAVPAERDKIPERNLQSIYKSCLDLFQTKKITNNNAFTCKLLDCLPQLIESPDFDVNNMQVVGRTLEMGSKIYVCRVDDTYDMVMGLAKRIGVKGKAVDRLHEFSEQQRQAEDDAENGEGDMELGDNELDENGDPIYAKEKKTREKKKRKGNYVAAKDKIRMVFPEKVEKYADRQARVKDIFNKFKETRQPVHQEKFDIQGGSGKDKEDDGIASEVDNDEDLMTLHKFPETLIKCDFGSRISFLQFKWLPSDVQFDREIYDAWGRSKQALAAAEEERQNALNVSNAGGPTGAEKDEIGNAVGGEYQFDANAEVDYGDDGMGVVEAEHFGYDGDSDHEDRMESQPRITDLGQVRSMAQLAEFYEALRTMGANKKMAFGWAGTHFLRNRLGGASRAITANSERKTRTKKVVQPFQLDKIDWKDPINQYDPLIPGKLELDDKTLEKWRQTKLSTFSNTESSDMFNEETYLDILSMNSNNHPDVEKFLRYFVDSKWNILQMFEEQSKENGDTSPDHRGFDDGDIDFDGGPRSQFEEGEDYCSHSLIEADLAAEPGQQAQFSGNMNLDTFLSFFPTITHTENAEYEEFMGGTSDSEGIKFAKQPKPINMRHLKHTILRILKQKLALDENFKSTADTDMTMDILSLLLEVFKRADERTARFLSTSLLFLALLHVAAEVGLFLEQLEGPLENINIIARRVGWDHRLHIPMALTEAAETERIESRARSLPPPSVEGEESEKENPPSVEGEESEKENPPSVEGEESEKENHIGMELDVVDDEEETFKTASEGSGGEDNHVSMEM